MEVRNHLRTMIVDGRLQPGHPLSENEVAAQLGLSRTPVREAFIKLEEEGLIVIYPQYGSFVAPIRVADVYDSQFVRESLECAALVRIIERWKPEHAAALEDMLAAQRRHLSGEPAPFFEADEAFHLGLMTMAGHARAWLVVEAAKGQHDRVRRLAMRDPRKRRAIYDEHAAVVEAMVRGDTAAALAAMRLHLQGVFASVEVIMGRHPDFFATGADGASPMPRRPAARRRRSAGAVDDLPPLSGTLGTAV